MKYIMTLAVLLCSLSAYAQTNDSLLSQQYYIGAHNIDQVWNTFSRYVALLRNALQRLCLQPRKITVRNSLELALT